jgi:chromosome partitioning protein
VYPWAMQTIFVANQKGGVGKTTLSTNLAAAAHLEGRRTRVLDLDRQGSAFDWYNARAQGSKLEGLVVVRADRALTLEKFRELSTDAEVVICDGPPRLGDITRAAAVAADVVLIPFRAGKLDWWASDETLQLIDSADAIRGMLGIKPCRRVFVLNAAALNTRILRAALDDVAQLDGELAPVVIGNRVDFPSDAGEGESVLTLHPGSPAASEIARLWSAVREAA